MSTKYFALLTKLGADRLANAAALGTKIEITQMAVGDGGGSLPTPDTTQTTLVNEKRRAAINVLSVDPKNTNQIIAEQVIPESEGGWWIREIGLFDKDGVLIAVGNCAETYKPQLQEGSGRTQTIRMVLIVSHTNAVTLKIDPSVVLATREYADTVVARAISEHEKSRHHPDATLTKKGFVVLSNAIDSNSETQAATPKAIQTVYAVAKNAVPNHRRVNGKPLIGDVELSATDVSALSVFGGTIISDNKLLELKNATAGAANYIYGTDSGGKARYLLGCGGGEDCVEIVNARTDTHLVVGKKRVSLDGDELATVKTVNDNVNRRVPVTRKINGKLLSSDITLTSADVEALSVFGGTIISDNKILELKNATAGAANYIYGTDSGGKARYLLGCGDGTDWVEIVNARTDTYLVVGNKRAFIDGNELATVKTVNDNVNGRVPINRRINGKSLLSDITLTSADVEALSVFGGTIISDNKLLELKNATAGAANYIYGTDSGGKARYLLGCGADAEHVSIVNARTDTHLVVGNKRAFIDGKELATVSSIPMNTLVKSTTGYWKCADTGLILQWGTINRADADSTWIQFPTLFPAECVNVQMTLSLSASGASTSNVQVRNRSTAGFTAIMAIGEIQCNWFAVGY